MRRDILGCGKYGLDFLGMRDEYNGVPSREDVIVVPLFALDVFLCVPLTSVKRRFVLTATTRSEAVKSNQRTCRFFFCLSKSLAQTVSVLTVFASIDMESTLVVAVWLQASSCLRRSLIRQHRPQ